jgi:hypothetical protein
VRRAYHSRALERFRHDRSRADALEAVVSAAASHLLDDLDKERSMETSLAATSKWQERMLDRYIG